VLEIPRRLVLGTLVAGAAGASAAMGRWLIGDDAPLQVPTADAAPVHGPVLPRVAIAEENLLPGSDAWRVGTAGTRAADDRKLQISGYAAQTSVEAGEAIEFHVSVARPTTFTVEVYRFGHYGGVGSRQVATSAVLHGKRQPGLVRDADTGMITCPWAPSWTLHVPADWTTGYYLAVFTTKEGYRSYAPFIVRDTKRAADFCVIVPATTYQAYNLWPSDGTTGKSLYYGFIPKQDRVPAASVNPLDLPTPPARPLDSQLRAHKVSFHRPYSNHGLPPQADYDLHFVQWAEESGYSVTYATSVDLNAGRVDPMKYRGLIFSGHDEYWTSAMRQQVTKAVAQGVSLVFLSANNIYWRIRIEDSKGAPDAAVTCYRVGDPITDLSQVTCRWRDAAGYPDPEQGLLGVQYNGIVVEPAPLVVNAADHWFWKDTGVRDGDSIPGVVGGEADGLYPNSPRPPGFRQTLLSSSVYMKPSGHTEIQNTSVCEAENGAIVFVAGSLTWTKALLPEGDIRIKRATANVLNRIAHRNGA
jgi:N,N-dimethylformamidase beta subunit-like, C-terminal